MVFVDGSNLLVQMAKVVELPFRADKPPSHALSMAAKFVDLRTRIGGARTVRRYWFASYKGNDETLSQYRNQLRLLSFEPKLFPLTGTREKGVDIALTKEMLVNAFQQNCDHIYLVAGDADYVELVEETKRYGQNVYGVFFHEGMSEDLRLKLNALGSVEAAPF